MARQRPPKRSPWLAFVLIASFGASMVVAPSRTISQDPAPRKPLAFPNSFGRFVNPPAPRILEPTPPRETKGLGGFFMPLKSFSNAVWGGTRSGSDGDDIDVKPSSQPRPSREPFSDSATEIQVRPPVSPPSRQERAARSNGSPVSDHDPSTLPIERGTGSSRSNSASTGPIGTGPIGTGTAARMERDTDPLEPTSESKTYVANPKTESLDSVGTSRKTKSSNSKKPSANSSNSTESSRVTGNEAKGESQSVQAVEAKLSEATLAKPSASETPSSGTATTETDSIGPSLSRSVRSSSDRGRSTRKPSSVPSQLASNPMSSNRSKTQVASNVGLDFHSPGLNLVMTGPDSILVGRAVPYELIATNEGSTSLNGLTIRLIVPANVTIEDPTPSDGVTKVISDEAGTGVAWEISQIPANESRTLKILVRTEQPEHFAMSLDWKIENPFLQIPIRVQQPQLILALEGASEADYGRPQIYRLRVRNPGNATAEQVRIVLQAEPNGSSEEIIGDLPPGTERVVEVELTFQQVGKVAVFAKAISQSSNLEASRNIDVEVRQSHLHATWDGPAEFYQGNTADYTLLVENRGSIESLDNKFSVTIPPGIEVFTLPPGVSRTENQLLWEVPRIAVGETLEWKFQFAMNRSGDHPFTVDASSSTSEATQTTLLTRVDAVADLALSVNDPISPAPVGKPVVYQIKISNRGKKAAEDVFVIAQFSDGIEPTRIEGHTGKLVTGQALFDNIPKIEPGEEMVLTVTAQASKPGTHRFRAAVRCQGSDDDLLKEESTRYAASGNVPSQSK